MRDHVIMPVYVPGTENCADPITRHQTRFAPIARDHTGWGVLQPCEIDPVLVLQSWLRVSQVGL